MDNTLRSGIDRRRNIATATNINKRSGHDRREVLNFHYRFVKVIEKIPVFRDLTIEQSEEILAICSKQRYAPGEYLCRADEDSLEMYILLAGQLDVTLPNGKAISKIKPLGIVGEMGIFTGEPRSASIVAVTDTIVLTINKTELMNLLQKDCLLSVHILLNVIKDLSGKLKHNNIILEEMREVCVTGEFTRILSKALMQKE